MLFIQFCKQDKGCTLSGVTKNMHLAFGTPSLLMVSQLSFNFNYYTFRKDPVGKPFFFCFGSQKTQQFDNKPVLFIRIYCNLCRVDLIEYGDSLSVNIILHHLNTCFQWSIEVLGDIAGYLP